VFLNYILHWGALRFYALLKGALTEKSLRKAGLVIIIIERSHGGYEQHTSVFCSRITSGSGLLQVLL